ncbi:hypothetical protein CDAR_2291, partial [Caerostris darwini]
MLNEPPAARDLKDIPMFRSYPCIPDLHRN